MSVYFIRAGDDGPVKIGFSTNVVFRIEHLRAASWMPLRVIRVIPHGTKALEHRLHKHFRHLEIRREWFRFAPEMLTVDLIGPPEFDAGLLSSVG